MCKVSVIVPVYNVEKYLRKCLDSIINQTYKDIEIILVDDGSIDKSGKICDEYKKQDRRIKVLHQKNSGVSYARLNGFNISQGKYITFVDPDDYLDLQAIEVMVSFIEKENVDLVVCQVKEVYGKILKFIKIRPQIGYYNKNDIIDLLKTKVLYDKKTKIAGINLCIWAKLIKRDFVKNSLVEGLNIIYAEDQIILIALLYKIKSMYVIPNYLYYYNCSRQGQVSKSYNEKTWNNLEIYLRKIISIDKNKFLVMQIDNRIMISIVSFLFIALENKNKDVILMLKNNTKLLKEINFNRLSLKNKFKYILLKCNMEIIYKILLKIKSRRNYE